MRRSTDHILSSNAGTLPRPARLQELFDAGPESEAAYDQELPEAVKEVVRQQAEIGLDVVNDGEFSKRGGFQMYARQRLSGIEQLPRPEGEEPPHLRMNERDARAFPSYYTNPTQTYGGGGGFGPNPFFCTAPIKYTDQARIKADIENLKAAVAGLDVEPYLPVVSPGNIEHWLWNKHYPDQESFLFAIADALHEEYKPITDAGIIVQIDDPDLADGWQMFPDMDPPAYRKYAEVRIEALNHALRDIPEELVRFHTCWGSLHGPHANDLPLREMVHVMLRAKAQCYSVEAANARHEHEWQVWKDVKLPEGRMIMPGVISHATEHVEHPELVAWRLSLYADCVGRESVVAGTDCGMARSRPAELCWAKLQAMTEGARLATRQLWKS